jgi:hypothetical protein
MAPEVCMKYLPSFNSVCQVCDEKVDVYSFAIILWELITLQAVWTDMTALDLPKNSDSLWRGAVLRAVHGNKRPPSPGNHGAELQQLVESCWKQDPADRPSFPEILVRRLYKCYLMSFCP